MTDSTMRGGEGEVDNISEGGNRSENTPIVNSILTFCVSILFHSTQKKIKLISTNFCVDEIKQAKTVLCNLVNEEFQDCHSTDLRTDKYANSQGVVNILKKKIDNKCMPYFVIHSYGLVKLPPTNPVELCFMQFQGNKLNLLQTLICYVWRCMILLQISN